MNLIIRDELLEPPTHLYSFRDLTLYATIFLHYDVLIESNDIDGYWEYIRNRRCHDFVKAMLRYDEERGIRVAPKKGDIVVSAIVPENVNNIIARLKRR